MLGTSQPCPHSYNLTWRSCFSNSQRTERMRQLFLFHIKYEDLPVCNCEENLNWRVLMINIYCAFILFAISANLINIAFNYMQTQHAEHLENLLWKIRQMFTYPVCHSQHLKAPFFSLQPSQQWGMDNITRSKPALQSIPVACLTNQKPKKQEGQFLSSLTSSSSLRSQWTCLEQENVFRLI